MNIYKQLPTEISSDELAGLQQEFGRNKKYPKEFEYPVLKALSYFPELKEQKIWFVKKKSGLAYASRPTLVSIVLPPSQRAYLVILSTESNEVPDELLFPNLTLNAQVGILGHELSHTSYYLRKGVGGIISTGFQYLFSKYRVKFERDTDKATIRRGLGFQLLEFAEYSRNHPKTTSKLRDWLNKFYLHPEDIKAYMKIFRAYNL